MTTLQRRHFLQGIGVLAIASSVEAGTAGAAAASPPGGPHRLPPATPLDGRPAPDFDFSRANRLPREMTGYWEKSFQVGGQRRTAKVYIPAETRNRSYYTVVAVPDGVDTETFLWKSTWRDVADQRGEGLYVLEPGPSGWRSGEEEADYVAAALAFYESNQYFSIFGEHYFVGYGGGAAALETYAVANPLKVIAQVYLGTEGLSQGFYDQHASREFDGTTAGSYTDVEFPDGFRLIRHDEVVLPTWYVDPRPGHEAGLAYWLGANDTVRRPSRDTTLGEVYHQAPGSTRWMTTTDGPISKVAVLERGASYWNKRLTASIVAFLTYYTRYENFFAYGNALYERADLGMEGLEIRTMTVEGEIREFLVHVPPRAREVWGDRAPVVFVWPGNTQTDIVFQDAAHWWKTAQQEGFVTVTICEQYSASPISVSHKNSRTFFLQLRDLLVREYGVDETRFYSTGQSAGSMVSNRFAIAFPEYFAAVAATSGGAAPDAAGNVTLDDVDYPATGQVIPQYFVYGVGDLGNIAGDPWDDEDNVLDGMVGYHLANSGLGLQDVESREGTRHGFHDRYQTWRWLSPGTDVPIYQLTLNHYRSHNTIPEETPSLWGYARHFSRETDADGSVRRYYSPSAFRAPGDRVRIS